MATVALGQMLTLQQELATTRLLLRLAVAEQERLEAVNADLVEMLSVMETERDQALADLRQRP